jgi:hypothetical protein
LGGGGSALRGNHTRHQSNARMTQGPGGRQAAAAGRRCDGEVGRRVAVLGSIGDAGRWSLGRYGERKGDAMEHGRGADFF